MIEEGVMRKSRNVLVGSLTVLGLLVVIFSGMAMKLQLDRPVVFHQYTELPLFPQDQGIKGQYFTLIFSRTDRTRENFSISAFRKKKRFRQSS